MNVGKYELNKATLAFSASLMLVGVAYAIYTKKPALTVLLIALVGSATGVGVGFILYPPKRVKE